MKSVVVARALERGHYRGFLSRMLSRAVSPVLAHTLVRPLELPDDVRVICVGGATLGGSGKTRVAMACARDVARRGRKVAFVGHAYRASPMAARRVRSDDALSDVGDEALVASHALARDGVRVYVGPSRQAAVNLALEDAPDVLVLDGPLAVPGSKVLSVLAVDADRPWGSGELPPSGDLRAPREVLLAHAHHVVSVPALPSSVRWLGEARRPLESLRGGRWGLFTAIARPDRLVRALRRAEIEVAEVVSVRDHGPLDAEALFRLDEARNVTGWLATAKCARHLESPPLRLAVGVLEAELELGEPVKRALAAL